MFSQGLPIMFSHLIKPFDLIITFSLILTIGCRLGLTIMFKDVK
jgi:hypothetical protein